MAALVRIALDVLRKNVHERLVAINTHEEHTLCFRLPPMQAAKDPFVSCKLQAVVRKHESMKGTATHEKLVCKLQQ